MNKDDIGDRFKAYEACFDYTLPRRLPLVIRVDGRAFHSMPLCKPFDHAFSFAMSDVAIALCEEIQGTRFAYHQSDEISVIARDDMGLGTEAWFGKRLSKVLSIAAAVATETFCQVWERNAQFDARAFVLPPHEVVNYFIWRQQDATRNSVSMAAQAAFSHRELQGKNSPKMLEMLREAGKPWEEIYTRHKRGVVVRQVQAPRAIPNTGEMCIRNEWRPDLEIPIFTQERGYLEALYGD